MRKLIVCAVLAPLLLAFAPGAAVASAPGTRGAWRNVDRDTGTGRAVAAGWTRDYRQVRFYGGHNRGSAGPFEAAWRVVCAGGFSFSRSTTVRDTATHYWGDTVRIPIDQGRCNERIVVRDSGVRMIAGIETR
jgi:hypothetical protein